jgi:flagellar basal-body rod protein FlgG
MIDAMMLAEAAMLNDTERLRLVAHNLANSATIGFKREIAVLRPLFDEALSAQLGTAAARPVASTAIDLSSGALKHTGEALDVAAEGDGLLVLKSALGEVYTRQGTFRLDDTGRLVSIDGLPVQGESGDILLSTPQPRIDGEGGIWEGDQLVARLRVVRFEDPQVLEPLGGGVFSAGDAQPQPVDVPSVRQGFLEAANVLAMHEMVRLIETVRHFETSQRLVRAQDTMMGTALDALGQL